MGYILFAILLPPRPLCGLQKTRLTFKPYSGKTHKWQSGARRESPGNAT